MQHCASVFRSVNSLYIICAIISIKNWIIGKKFLISLEIKYFWIWINSSYSYFVEFLSTWQQCLLERMEIPRQVSKARFSLLHRWKWVSPASVKSKIWFITLAKNKFPRSVSAFPGFYCPPIQFSLASGTARRSCLAAVAEFPGKCKS